MKSKPYSAKEGLEFYIEMHHIIESANELEQVLMDDAKKTVLDIILNLPPNDIQVDSRQMLKDIIKIRSSVFKLKSYLEIIKFDLNKSFPFEEKKLEEIALITDKMIHSIDWTKINKEFEENDFMEDEFDEEDFTRKF